MPPPTFDFATAKVNVAVNLSEDRGPLELWRQSLGAGGINSRPMPGRVVEGLAKLKPKLVRIFIQEFFNIYPEHGHYDWSKLDPYMDCLEKIGGKVVAAITIKPPPLYPAIDASVWRPNNVKEWQQVIAAMVKRYSVDRRLVTYWEIGNETDIGENGGCPYLIPNAKDYTEYYAMTIAPILEVFPKAKVGGPAIADDRSALLPGFVEICRRDNLQMDFISWHLYSDSFERHAANIEKFQKVLAPYGDRQPETLITEWNKGFDQLSLEELAYDRRRPAAVAAAMLAMNEAKVSWTFYYHVWDQVAYHGEFEGFFKKPEIMYKHWNEVPHRFGLFGVEQEVRPQYFVYQMLGRMHTQRVAAQSDCKDIAVLASRAGETCSVLMVNYRLPRSEDKVSDVQINGLTPGIYKLTVFRIDGRKGWSAQSMELEPVEQREVDVRQTFSFQTYSPADSVSLITLAPMKTA